MMLMTVSPVKINATPLELFPDHHSYIDLYKNEHVYDTYLYPLDSGLSYGAAFHNDFTFIKFGKYSTFVNSNVHFDQHKDTGHIKHGGWEYLLGLSLIPDKVELIKYHHSQHVLEETRPGHFPVTDFVGIRIHISK
jgi:hypothetical protein